MGDLMGLLVDSVLDIFRKSFSLKAWLYFIVLFVIAMVVGLVIAMVAGIFVFFGVAMAASTMSPAALLPVLFVAMLIMIPLFIAFGVFIQGLSLYFARDFLAGKKVSIGDTLSKAFNRTIARFWAVLGTEIIITIIYLLILGVIGLILFAPLIPPLMELASTNPAELEALVESAEFFQMFAPMILYLVVAIFVLAVIAFFIHPFFVLSFQVPFFENKGIIESVKRVLGLGKRNYFLNLSFTIVFLLVLAIPLLIYMLIAFLPYVGMMPGSAGSKPEVALVGIFIIGIIISTVLRILFQIWFSILDAFYKAKIYELNIKAEKPARAPAGRRY